MFEDPREQRLANCLLCDNSDKFQTFICYCLEFIYPGDVVIRDNCSFHQQGESSGMAQWLITAKPAPQYKLLPKYSPELSPAEKVFSFLKSHLCPSFNVCDDLLASIITILLPLSPFLKRSPYP